MKTTFEAVLNDTTYPFKTQSEAMGFAKLWGCLYRVVCDGKVIHSKDFSRPPDSWYSGPRSSSWLLENAQRQARIQRELK